MTTRKPIDDGPYKLTAASSPATETYLTQRSWLLALVLVIVTFVAYQPVWHAGFIWDDDAYVTRNPLLTAPDGLERIWFSAHSQSQYVPLVYTTLRFEHTLWGLDPVGYHLVNIVLHALNALLVWAVLRKLAIPGSWLAAAIWAVHPVNVESVAWITELKNTQSTLFYLLALLAWMKFTAQETGRPWRFYRLALALHALALFSKTTACTLPAAMLLVLWLRRQSIGWGRLKQVAPFMALGVAMGLFSVWWEAHLGNYGKGLHYLFNGLERVLIATRALWFYATKLIWPTKLTFSYPRWEIDVRDPLQYMWLIGCVAVALFLWWRRQALGRAPVAAVVFFVAALSPLLGFIPLYTFRFSFVADHYQYVASIGLIALFAGAVFSHADTWQLGHNTRCTLSASLLVVLGALTWQQARIYQNSETLWRDTLTKNPQSWIAYNNLGYVQAQKGDVDAAISNYEHSLQLNPENERGYFNLGNVFLDQGHPYKAIGYYEETLRLRPDFADAHNNLGKALFKTGDPQGAIRHFQEALRLKPTMAAAHYNLGVALEKAGRVPEAIQHYEQALRIDPDYPQARNALARLQGRQ